MVIVALLFSWLALRLYRIRPNRAERTGLVRRFIVIFLVSVSALTFLQYELEVEGFNDGTTGSDATEYYAMSLKISDGELPISQAYQSYEPGYYILGAFVDMTSFYRSVLWMKLCNIFIFLHLLLSLYLILRKKNGFSPQISLLAVSVVSISGCLIWSTIRNLKDILTVFLTVESILIWENYSGGRRGVRGKAKLLVILGLITFSLSTLRDFSIPIVFAISIYYMYVLSKGSFKKRAVSIIVSILLIATILLSMYSPKAILQTYERAVQLRIEQFKSEKSQLAFISSKSYVAKIALGLVRIVVLPVPTKYLLLMDSDGSDGSVFTGFSNDFWHFAGSSLWWLLSPLLIMGLCTRKYWTNKGLVALGIVAFSYVLVYGSMYIGGGDVRDRIPLYIFGIIVSVVKMKDLGIKKFQFYYPLIGILVLFVGLWWTVR